MNRFLFFAGDNYYPRGGVSDLIYSGAERDDVVAMGTAIMVKHGHQWFHMYDAETRKIVAYSRGEEIDLPLADDAVPYILLNYHWVKETEAHPK